VLGPCYTLRVLVALAALLEVVWLLVLVRGDLRHGALPGTLALLGLASVLYLLALIAVARRPASVGLILGAAVVFRLTLLPLDPSLSFDAWRYLWEGRVQLAGVNPYALPPAAEALAALRDGAWLRVNHPHVPAVYGPVLEALFVPLARLGGGLLTFKLTFVAADLGIAWLLARALARRGRSPALALAWAWHPLPILEVAGQAHLEVVPIALTLLALDLEATRRPRAAALALGAAIAAKYLPLLLLPALLLRAPPRARPGLLALALLPGLLFALPYLLWDGGATPADTGVAAYASSWRANDGGFLLVARALEGLGLSQRFCRELIDAPPGVDPALHTTWILILPKLVVGALALVAALRVARAGARDVDLARACFVAAATFVVFSPVVHPWYALWLLPALALRRARAGPWLLLTLAAPLAYAALVRYDGTDASWIEPGWARACEYLPPLAWLCAGRIRRP
jgi:alpha-1,6-mannosyltransferase